jgi:hypothetical protein
MTYDLGSFGMQQFPLRTWIPEFRVRQVDGQTAQLELTANHENRRFNIDVFRK